MCFFSLKLIQVKVCLFLFDFSLNGKNTGNSMSTNLDEKPGRDKRQETEEEKCRRAPCVRADAVSCRGG